MLDFIHLIDKRRRQDNLKPPITTKEAFSVYLAHRDYDHINTI